MTTTNQNNMGSEVGRRLVKIIIAVVGLLIIRLVLDNLPMLKEAKPIYVGSGSSPAANADWANILQQYSNGQMPQNVQDLARQFTFPYIFPISIANAVVDTLIFAMLIGSAAGFNGLIRARSKRLPEGGVIILLLVLTIVVAFAYKSYMGVIPPLLQSQANLYGWIFLILGLLPLIGLIVVASRNLDALTEVVFSSTSRATAGGSQQAAMETTMTCPKCSAAIAAGAKFCGSCGAPAPVSVPAGVFCPGCGTKNESKAKFCKNCGKSLA